MGNHEMKRICTICARGGSKGVPNKNIRPLLGKTLIAYTIEQARDSKLFQTIAVSSDSRAILDAAKAAGADLIIERPPELATDAAAKVPAIVHCLKESERLLETTYDIEVDLDVTSPLRLPADIIGAVQLLESTSVTNIITGKQARHSPYFNLVERSTGGYVSLSKFVDPPIQRRQDAPDCFDMNGSVYVWWRDRLLREPRLFYEDTLLYEMPPERSVDIDSELDFQFVEFLLRTRAEG
jgi:CMP-N,N'-diacetyllegionaminic acid synthase